MKKNSQNLERKKTLMIMKRIAVEQAWLYPTLPSASFCCVLIIVLLWLLLTELSKNIWTRTLPHFFFNNYRKFHQFLIGSSFEFSCQTLNSFKRGTACTHRKQPWHKAFKQTQNMKRLLSDTFFNLILNGF